MQIYDKPVRELMIELVERHGVGSGELFSREDMIQWFQARYPLIKKSTISAHLIRLSTNAPSRVHYNPKPGRDDKFFQVDPHSFRWYDEETDPPPIYKKASARSPTGTSSLLKGITDRDLKERLSRLESAPLDTVVREAGVILEDRLRVEGGVAGSLHGVALVDAVLGPDAGALVFSPHRGEQDGIRMLYRGAMQFIRNPPMHKIVEYSEETVRLFLRLVDCLLRLLSELEPRRRGEPTVDDIRRMLTRMRIPRGQCDLYKALYAAGDKGLSGSELARATNRTKQELSGVLGALGRRVNGTDGLRGKGGIEVILQVRVADDGDWHYCMRPILREALEIENLV